MADRTVASFVDRIQDVLVDFLHDPGRQRRELSLILQDYLEARAREDFGRASAHWRVRATLRFNGAIWTVRISRGPWPWQRVTAHSVYLWHAIETAMTRWGRA